MNTKEATADAIKKFDAKAETEKNWGAAEWRKPTVLEGETVLRSECGRITHNIDYRSHWFILIKSAYTEHILLVRHGGGEERIHLPICNANVLVSAIQSLGSDEAYIVMHQLFDIWQHSKRAGRDEATRRFQNAFIDGRLKKRRFPKQGIVKVWIENPKVEVPNEAK